MALLIAAPDDTTTSTSLSDTLALGNDVSVVVPGNNPVRIPTPLLRILVMACQALSEGKKVVVGSQDTLISTQVAADLIGVSRPTLVKLLESGQLPFERRSSHRRVRLGALAQYAQSERERRRSVLDEMSDRFSDLSRLPDIFVATR